MPAAEAIIATAGSGIDVGPLTSVLTSFPACAVAVSGGSDSVALLHLAAHHAGRCRVTALTVDHGLRAGSDAEVVRVANWCAALNIPHVTLTWEGKKPASGIQAKARQARYDLLAQWCARHAVPVLLTAHTMDDQAETVVMRRARTDSAASIAAIWPETQWNGIRIRRPLLQATRQALRQYLRSVGQPWLEDPSNENDRFERVRVRRALAGADIAGLAAVAASAQSETLSVAHAAETWLQAHATVDGFGCLTLPRARLLGLPEGEQVAILARVIRACGGLRPERAEIRRAAAALAARAPHRITLGGAMLAIRLRDVLVGREPGRIPVQPVPVPEGGRLTWDGRFEIMSPPGWHVRPAGKARPAASTGLPAFVLDGLPVLENGAGRLVFPHFSADPAFSVRLGERFGA